MVNFLCTPSCSRIALTVAMETMHFFIVQLSLSLRTKILCISGVPMNDLAPMKNCPGGCKVDQISSRGIGGNFKFISGRGPLVHLFKIIEKSNSVSPECCHIFTVRDQLPVYCPIQ